MRSPLTSPTKTTAPPPPPTQATSLSPIEHVRKEDRPDYSHPSLAKKKKKKINEKLQKTFENDEIWWDTISSGTASESSESNVRYAAYASSYRTILLSAHRYVAYTSDIGGTFRSIAHPIAIEAAYGMSWTYLTGDVGYEGCKAYLRNQRSLHLEKEDGSKDTISHGAGESRSLSSGITADSIALQSPEGRVVPIEDYRAIMAQRAIFQGLASMDVPAFTMHSIVYSGQALENATSQMPRTWGPIGLLLTATPAQPYMFDEPVEKATDWVFHNTFKAVGGEDAARHSPETGKTEMEEAESKSNKVKEKVKELYKGGSDGVLLCHV